MEVNLAPADFLTPAETDKALRPRRGPVAVQLGQSTAESVQSVLTAATTPDYSQTLPNKVIQVIQPHPDAAGQNLVTQFDLTTARRNTELVRSTNDPLTNSETRRFSATAFTVEEFAHALQCKAGRLPADTPPPPRAPAARVSEVVLTPPPVPSPPVRETPAKEAAQAPRKETRPSWPTRVVTVPPEAPEVAMQSRDVPKSDEPRISGPTLPEVGPPERDVVFYLPLGTLVARYHHVVVSPTVVVCIYDTRWKFGTQFSPPDNIAFEVEIPQMQARASVYTCGLKFGFGVYDVEVLYRPPVEPVKPAATPLERIVEPAIDQTRVWEADPAAMTAEDDDLLATYFGPSSSSPPTSVDPSPPGGRSIFDL